MRSCYQIADQILRIAYTKYAYRMDQGDLPESYISLDSRVREEVDRILEHFSYLKYRGVKRELGRLALSERGVAYVILKNLANRNAISAGDDFLEQCMANPQLIECDAYHLRSVARLKRLDGLKEAVERAGREFEGPISALWQDRAIEAMNEDADMLKHIRRQTVVGQRLEQADRLSVYEWTVLIHAERIHWTDKGAERWLMNATGKHVKRQFAFLPLAMQRSVGLIGIDRTGLPQNDWAALLVEQALFTWEGARKIIERFDRIHAVAKGQTVTTFCRPKTEKAVWAPDDNYSASIAFACRKSDLDYALASEIGLERKVSVRVEGASCYFNNRKIDIENRLGDGSVDIPLGDILQYTTLDGDTVYISYQYPLLYLADRAE